MVYTIDLGSIAARHGGSSPLPGTNLKFQVHLVILNFWAGDKEFNQISDLVHQFLEEIGYVVLFPAH
jgi:hypothetical protein